jgi:hypothetical protein
MALLRAFLVCLGIAVFTWLGFRYFPGHTYLQSGTQIYVPMLERISDRGFLARDIVATRPHIAFTAYDEITLTLHKALHVDIEHALVGQQLLFRAAAMFGVYLLATSAGIPAAFGLLIAAFLNLGTYLAGPAIRLVAYEPVPLAFGFSLILLALGLLAQRLPLLAGFAAGLAFLYHPPITIPFWGIAFLAMAFGRDARKRWKPMPLVFCIACLLLANLAQLQPDMTDSPNLFGTLSKRVMALQHFRTKWSWVSLWAPSDMWHYGAICILGLWATSRIWPEIRREIRVFFICLPLWGIVAVPVSYLMLGQLHLAIAPQFQLTQALLYTVALAMIAGGLAAVRAAQKRRIGESIGWFLVVLALPVNTRIFDLFLLRSGLEWRRFAVWVALAAIAGLAATFLNRNWLRPISLLVPAAAVFALPMLARVPTPPKLDLTSITELAQWAKKTTWGSSMFLFPDAGRSPFPGIFRALSERALYVDWQSGVHMTYYESFANEWYPRYEQTMDGRFTVVRLENMLALPIDYYVLHRNHRLAKVKPVFENREYVVYDAQDLRNESTSLRLGTED